MAVAPELMGLPIGSGASKGAFHDQRSLARSSVRYEWITFAAKRTEWLQTISAYCEAMYLLVVD